MKKLLSVCLVLSMLLALVACGGDTPASTASGASPASGSGTSAEPSGKLVIYSPNSDTQVASSLTNGFMVKYPNIEVELQSMGTGDVLARIEAEKENPQISTGAPSTTTSIISTPTCGSRMFRPMRKTWTKTTATTQTAMSPTATCLAAAALF